MKCTSERADPISRACLDDLAEQLGSAGRDVRYIGNDMAGFSQVRFGPVSLFNKH
jgi:hypothetical protein